MSRKTAVCVLFVLVLAIVGTASPTAASPGTADGFRTVSAEHNANMDPDGITAPELGSASALLTYLVRTLLGSFVL